MCDGLIETLGRVEFDGKVEGPITAHPKPDPRTGILPIVTEIITKK